MKNFTSHILFLLIAQFANAQMFFQKTIGGSNDDWAFSVQHTLDSGFIVAGTTRSLGSGNGNIYLIKTNSNGNTLWTRAYGGTNTIGGNSVKQTMDSGYVVTGNITSLGSGGSDVYLLRTNGYGDTLWTKTYGGTNDDAAHSVQQTTDGGYIFAGSSESYSGGLERIYVVKTNSSGDTLWSKTYGGFIEDIGRFVQQTADGGYIIVGHTWSFGAGGQDVFLIKTDNNGIIIWSKTFGGPNHDYGYSVQQTLDGGYIVTGITSSFGAGSWDVYLIKTDINGNIIWSKSYGGANNDLGNSVQQTNDGGYIVCGNTYSFGAGSQDVYLIKTNSNGDTLWTKTFGAGSYDGGYSVQQTSYGGYFIAGGVTGIGVGAQDVYLLETDGLGNSGCYEASTATIVASSNTTVTTPAPIVNSVATIITIPALQVSVGDTVTTLCAGTVDVSEMNTDSFISISPNPSLGYLVITLSGLINSGVIEIYNLIGEKIIAEKITNESRKEINLQIISSGVYFVKVFDGDKSFSKKLIIEHD